MEAVIGRRRIGKPIPSSNARVDRNLGVHEYTVQTHCGAAVPAVYSHCGSCLGATLLDNNKYLWSMKL